MKKKYIKPEIKEIMQVETLHYTSSTEPISGHADPQVKEWSCTEEEVKWGDLW